MKKLGLVLSIVAVIAIALGLFFYDMGVDNKEMALRERFKGQEKICMTSHDAMWKIINQDAQVSDKYKQDFEDAYGTIVDGMLSDDAMFQWLAGFNPQLSVETYMELMKTIKDERTKFKRAQDICVDVSREYATFIKTKPRTWFINDEILDAKDLFRNTKDEVAEMNIEQETQEAYKILTYKPVTSTRTEDVFKSGKDDDVDLFGKKEKDVIDNKVSEINKDTVKTGGLTAEQKEAKLKEFDEFMKKNPQLLEQMKK